MQVNITSGSPRVILHSICDKFLDSKPVAERLLELSMRTGYDCIQKNGQRYYGPPPTWSGSPPEKGSEVFIGSIPRDCFEDEIVPVFETIGTIYEMRMMMNFTGFNRGFAFVTYTNPEFAWKAVLALNGYEIRPGHKIGVTKSVNNCRLYVGRIPHDKNKEEVWEEASRIMPHLRNIIVYPDVKEQSKNRGFFFAEFDSHRLAAMTKRFLSPGTIKMWDQNVVVEWATPEPDVDPNIMASVRKLFIRNLDKSINNDYLRTLLSKSVPVQAVQRVFIAGHYAFIHFDNRAHAQRAKEDLSQTVINGEQLEVHWARPRYCKKYDYSPCKSFPRKLRCGFKNNNNEPESISPIPFFPVHQFTTLSAFHVSN